MVEIDFPHVFLDVEELAKRWHCGIGVIEMLAETGQIGCCIRPVALKIALKRNWPPEQRPNTVIPNHHHLDQEEIYNLFQNPRTPQTINSHKKKIPDAPAIKAKFSDLIVYVECIQAFESKYKKNRELDFQILAKDFTFIRWQGREIKFGETQGKVLRILWQAIEDGEPWVYGKRILSAIGSGSDRIKGIFRHHKFWRELIEADSKGKYRLNLPPKIGLSSRIDLSQ